MLLMRNIRSRTVSSKQAEAVMTDHTSPKTSPTQSYPTPTISPLFGNSPRLLFPNLTTKYPSAPSADPEAVMMMMMSPTSIIDTKPTYPSSLIGNPSNWCEKNLPRSPERVFSGNKHSWEKLDSGKGIGLALVDEKLDEPNSSSEASSNSRRRKVVFGPQLKIQIPPLVNFSPSSTTPSSQPGSGNANPLSQTEDSARGLFKGCLSLEEIELSENYTCVISHGPNPRTTHIFDDCIVESCCGEVGSFALKKKKSKKKKGSLLSYSFTHNLSSPSQNSLSFCHTCKQELGQERDIYMYRGEEAFCSRECRSQEMLFDCDDFA